MTRSDPTSFREGVLRLPPYYRGQEYFTCEHGTRFPRWSKPRFYCPACARRFGIWFVTAERDARAAYMAAHRKGLATLPYPPQAIRLLP